MADRVKITNAKDLRNDRRLKQIKNKLDSIERDLSDLDEIDRRIRELGDNIDRLRARIEEIERTKASARRQAVAEFKDELRERKDEKLRQYRNKRDDVLDDYRGAVERLKDRFVGSISGREEQFEQVEEEFATVQEAREATAEATAEAAAPATANYEDRLNEVIASRNGCVEAINEFLADREETADTIDSLQTSIQGIDGNATVVVPFWVVGVETGDGEEVRVHPVLGRQAPSGAPDRGTPYLEYLREHPTHSYGDMTEAVHAYAVRDEVRDALAAGEREFADPAFLRRSDGIMDRFVDALEEFEIDGRTVAGGRDRPSDADRDRERADEESGRGRERTVDGESGRDREHAVSEERAGR